MTNLNVLIITNENNDNFKKNITLTSKNNIIYLIGDLSVSHMDKLPNVHFINIDKYLKDQLIFYFKKHFVNYSSNSANYEWFRFFKVFIIKLFLLEYKFNSIFHIDSNNILLFNINNYEFKKNVAYCINKNWHHNRMSAGIHSGLLNLNYCKIFEQLYVDIYITKSKFFLIEDKIKYHKNNLGGISEMTLHYLIDYLNLIEVENLCKPKKINNNYYVFINNLNNSEGYDNQNQYITENNMIKLSCITKKINKMFIYDQINDLYLEPFNLFFKSIIE